MKSKTCLVKPKNQIVKVGYIKLHAQSWIWLHNLGFKLQIGYYNMYNMFVLLVVHLHSKKDDLYAQIFMEF